MKIRNGFVSNSSSSSFCCSVCGEKFTDYDACPSDFDCTTCENEHIICNEHLKDTKIEPEMINGCEHEFDRKSMKFCPECGRQALIEDDESDGSQLSEKYCPICQFKLYAEEEMSKYLEKTRKIDRAEVFAKVKAMNKRRRVLYEAEYISHVCEKFSLTDDILLKEIKDKFGKFEEYYKFINKKD